MPSQCTKRYWLGISHVISKKYTQRIERHNLNLRSHFNRLARRTICFSKSEVMHDKIIDLVSDD